MNTNSYKNIKSCKMQKVQIITLEAMMVISVVLRSCMKWRRAAVMTLERSNSKKKKRRWWWLLCGGLWCFVRKKVRAGVEPPCPRTSVATDASNQSWALCWLLNSWVLKRTTREKIPIQIDIYSLTGSGPFEVSHWHVHITIFGVGRTQR